MSVGFIGKYSHTLDPKGRVFIPKRFLAAIPDSEPRELVVTKGLDGCLFLYTRSTWDATVESMNRAALGNPDARGFTRIFFANAAPQAIDGSGRILIPDDLREEAGITREVVFVGVQSRIELWDHERWRAFYGSVKKDYESFAKGVLT